jgi:hypothetical protein
MICWKCGTTIDVGERVGFRDECTQCGSPLHVCLNCRFYEPGYHNECQEPMAERVVEKARSNFCEFFAPAPASTTARRPNSSARSQLDALFRKRQ